MKVRLRTESSVVKYMMKFVKKEGLSMVNLKNFSIAKTMDTRYPYRLTHLENPKWGVDGLTFYLSYCKSKK